MIMEQFAEMESTTEVARRGVFDEYARLMWLLRFADPQTAPWFGIDLTLPQLKVVWLLATHPKGMHGRELSSILGVVPSAVTALVERLVEHGYARRDEDRQDRRLTQVRLTEEGHALAERFAVGQRDRLDRILQQLKPEDLEYVLQALRTLRQAGESIDSRAPALLPAQSTFRP
jgi:DNA-binding MarR family transcriptional regulator